MAATETVLTYPNGLDIGKLVNHVCTVLNEKNEDRNSCLSEFTTNFIVCYHRYTKPKLLFKQIEGNIEIKCRIIGCIIFLRFWLQKYFLRDFYSHYRARTRFRSLLTIILKISNHGSLQFELNKLKLIILREHRRIKNGSQKVPPYLIAHKVEVLPQSSIKSLFTFNSKEIADRLMMLEFNMFSKVDPSEFISKNGKILKAMIDRSNKMSYWVASNILAQKGVHNQVHAICRFIAIAHFCYKNNNYNSLMAIMNGFNFQFISRLSKLWTLDQQYRALLQELRSFCSPMTSYKNYRAIVRKRYEQLKDNIPTLPYIGVYSRDIALINEGNPDFLPDGTINGEKLTMITKILSEIRQFQAVSYHDGSKQKHPTLTRYLTSSNRWSERQIN